MANLEKFMRKHSCIIISVLLLFVIVLSLQNAGILPEQFNNMNNNGEPTIALFHANWCGHCKNLMPHWKKFEKSHHQKDNILVVNVESDDNPALIKKHGVRGFPTIKYCPKGVNNTDGTITYEGSRNLPGLIEFHSQCNKRLQENFTENLQEHDSDSDSDSDSEDEKKTEGYNTESFYNY